MEEPKKNIQSTPTVSRVLSDGRIIELVYHPETCKTEFAVYQNGSITFEDSINADGERLVPVSPLNNLLKHKVVLLPEQPDSYESVEVLLNDIQGYLYRYVDLSDGFLRIASCYILLTWVYDAFNELPYLRLRGDYGSGKTRALLVIGSVCYKAFFASGASSVSPIFHILNMFSCSLVFDETDFRFSDEKNELVKIFNQGNVRGFPVLRTAITQKGEFDPRAFMVYGPKIVAMRNSFEDQALESRFLTEEMGQRSLRKDIPINLPEEQKEEALCLRNKLLMYRFQTLPHARINKTLVDPSLSPRLNQILVPLLSVIEDETLRNEIRTAARGLEIELRAEKSAAPEGELLELLVELTNASERPHIPLSEITSLFIERHGADYERPITSRYIGHLLRKRLRLHTYKSHGVYVMPLTEQPKIEVLCKRYGISANPSSDGGENMPV